MASPYLTLILLTPTMVLADPVLRYRGGSCNTLEPGYVEENWQVPGTPPSPVQEEDLSLFDTPTKTRDRNPPFSVVADFSQYRRGRDYTVSIFTTGYFDAFILQARAADRLDGNATLVGEWRDLPSITTHLKCIGTRRSTVVDKGRPVLLGNMTFTWRAPTIDFGTIKFFLSVTKGDRYTEVTSPSIVFNAFPVSIHGCGRMMTCFRRCNTNPTCPAEESDFMVVMDLSKTKEEVVISMGGVVEEMMQSYIAVGFGRDKQMMRSMDVSVCSKDGETVRLAHYHVEDKHSQPYPHRAELSLDSWDLDTTGTTTFLWCQFRRPVRPETMWDLDMTVKMFQFFFTGVKNQTMIELPDAGMIWASRMKRNISEITNDINFSGRASKSSATTPFAATLTLFIGIVCIIF